MAGRLTVWRALKHIVRTQFTKPEYYQAPKLRGRHRKEA